MNEEIDREVWIEFCLSNNRHDLDGQSGTRHNRPPLFFIGPHPFKGKPRGDQVAICLPFASVAQRSDSLDDLMSKLIYIIQRYQDKGPYLLGGYCAAGYVVYEIARRLASCGHEVGLLALVECTGPGGAWLVFARGLLFALTYPTELVSYAGRKLHALKARAFGGKRVWEKRDRGAAGVFESDLINKLLEDYLMELEQGRVTYSGSLVLLFGRKSRRRFLPARGWKKLIGEGLKVLVVPGDHCELLFEGEGLAIELRACMDRALKARGC